MTTPDDELLALARKATQGQHVAMDARTLNAPATCIDFAVVAGNKETARVWTEDDARYYAAANPSAIIAMHERHRAEVERLTRENTRLFKQHCGCTFDEGENPVAWCAHHAEVRVRAESAESALATVTRERDEARREAERLSSLINTPHIDDFLDSVRTEAAHQIERWGAEHDEGKTDADWFWLIGYLAGKALNKPDKKLHHIITTAAACLNWHGHATGAQTAMRPGISPSERGINDAA